MLLIRGCFHGYNLPTDKCVSEHRGVFLRRSRLHLTFGSHYSGFVHWHYPVTETVWSTKLELKQFKQSLICSNVQVMWRAERMTLTCETYKHIHPQQHINLMEYAYTNISNVVKIKNVIIDLLVPLWRGSDVISSFIYAGTQSAGAFFSCFAAVFPASDSCTRLAFILEYCEIGIKFLTFSAPVVTEAGGSVCHICQWLHAAKNCPSAHHSDLTSKNQITKNRPSSGF